MPLIYLLVVAAVAAGGALVLRARQSPLRGLRIPARVAVPAIAATIALGLVPLLWTMLPPSDQPPDDADTGFGAPADVRDVPVAAGEAAPRLIAAGWINGPPEPSARLIVVDIWAPW